MKKTFFLIVVAALALSGCAKGVVTGKNDATKRYIESYIKVYYPSATTTKLGSYILQSTKGSGPAIGTQTECPYLYVDYTAQSLEGDYILSTDPQLMKKIGMYSEGEYCGPTVWVRKDNNLMAGFDEIVSSMNEGGTVRTLIPGWLATTNRYNTAKEYLDNEDGTSSSAIYDIKVLKRIPDIRKWQIDSMVRYMGRYFPKKSASDSVKYGHYFISVDNPSGKTIPQDTTFYVNYIGRLLDGTVFDTNIKDTAKVYKIYKSSRTYSPTAVKVTKTDDKLTTTFGGSTPIEGFGLALQKIHYNEKAVTIFYSNLGYGSTGTGAIPSYSPLRFDLEVVPKPQ